MSIKPEMCRMSIAASGSGGVVRSLHVQSFVYSLSRVDARACDLSGSITFWDQASLLRLDTVRETHTQAHAGMRTVCRPGSGGVRE